MFDQQNYLSRQDDSKTGVRMDDDENQFIVEDVAKVINDILDNFLGTNEYVPALVHKWSSTVSENILTALNKMKKPFKYVVTSSLMQKNGAGLHTGTAFHWDNSIDASCTVRWENSSLCAVITVFGVAL